MAVEEKMTVEEMRKFTTIEEIAGMDATTETKVMCLCRLQLDGKISYDELSVEKWKLYLA